MPADARNGILASNPGAARGGSGENALNESNPQRPEEEFFHQLKGRTALAYYTSKIGIHQEMEYKGNTILEEFAGFDAGLVPIQPAPK